MCGLGGAQGHIAVEAVLVLLLLAMFVQRAYKPGAKPLEELTDKVASHLSAPPHPLAPRPHADCEGTGACPHVPCRFRV